MHFDDQHKALENIFDFVKSQGRTDLINKYRNAAKTKETLKKVKAKKKWKCFECKCVIDIGCIYYRKDVETKTSSGSSFISKQTCINCFEKTEKVDKLKNFKFTFISNN